MKATGIAQAIILLLLLATAASCEVGKEYASRVFRSSPAKKIDKTALRFMETNSVVASNNLETKAIFSSAEKKDTIALVASVSENKKPIEPQPTGTVRIKKVRQ